VLLKSRVQWLVTILYCYLLNSLTFTIVKMPKNGKSRLKHWSGPISHLKKWESFLGIIILMGQVRKENVRDYWSTDPTISHLFFLTLWVGTVLNPFGRPDILVTAASKYNIQGSYSKFGLCMNIFYRNLGQYTAQNNNCHLMKPWSHGGVAWNLGHTIQGK